MFPFGLEDFPTFVNHVEFPDVLCYRVNGGLGGLLGHPRLRAGASRPRVPPLPQRRRAPQKVLRRNSTRTPSIKGSRRSGGVSTRSEHDRQDAEEDVAKESSDEDRRQAKAGSVISSRARRMRHSCEVCHRGDYKGQRKCKCI